MGIVVKLKFHVVKFLSYFSHVWVNENAIKDDSLLFDRINFISSCLFFFQFEDKALFVVKLEDKLSIRLDIF